MEKPREERGSVARQARTGSAPLEPGGRGNVVGAAGLSQPNRLSCHVLSFPIQ